MKYKTLDIHCKILNAILEDLNLSDLAKKLDIEENEFIRYLKLLSDAGYIIGIKDHITYGKCISPGVPLIQENQNPSGYHIVGDCDIMVSSSGLDYLNKIENKLKLL